MELENRDRDAELEELLEKYGATGRRNQGSKMLTPDRVPTSRLRRFMSRDEDMKLAIQKSSDFRPRAVLGENQSLRRPSPIRHDSDSEDMWKARVAQSPISVTYPTPRSPITGRDKDIGESKAFSMAMKALQDRVKFLETENGRLQDEKGRLARMHTSGDTFLSDMDQSYRSKDQSDLVASLSAELKEKTTALTKADKDVKSLTDELRRAKDAIERLQSEQYRRPDRVLEARCHTLEEQNSAQKIQLEQLRRELEELRRTQKPESRPGLFTPKSRSKSPLESGRDADDVGRYVVTEGDYLESTRTAYFGEGGDEEKRGTEGYVTSRLERELEEYSQRYKSLLQQCQDPHTDLSALRSELNVVAAAIENKSSQLASLQRQRSRDLGVKKNYGYV